MGKDFHKRVSGLESRLNSIRKEFDTCSSNIQGDQIHFQQNLAKATGRAMSILKVLIQHLSSSQPSSFTNSVLQDMKSAWSAVDSHGKACCSCAREYCDSLLSHGDDLRKWSKEAKLVEAELHLSLRAVQNDVASETASLQKHHEEMEIAKSAVDEASRDNIEVQRKCYEVQEWTAAFPTAWDFHQKLQIALQARVRSLKQAEANLDKCKMRVNKSESKLDSYKSRLETLSAMTRRMAGIQAKGHSLSRRYRAIAGDATDALGAMDSLKTAYREASELVHMMDVGMYKLEGAKYLLGIIHAALDDHTLVSELADVIHLMEYGYDTPSRVHSITTPEHPYGLLNGVQKKLRSQQLRIVPPRAFDMYPVRDVSTKSLAALNMDMMRSIIVALERDERRAVRVRPCRVGRGELTDMLRHNIRMTWGDTLEGDY